MSCRRRGGRSEKIEESEQKDARGRWQREKRGEGDVIASEPPSFLFRVLSSLGQERERLTTQGPVTRNTDPRYSSVPSSIPFPLDSGTCPRLAAGSQALAGIPKEQGRGPFTSHTAKPSWTASESSCTVNGVRSGIQCSCSTSIAVMQLHPLLRPCTIRRSAQTTRPGYLIIG